MQGIIKNVGAVDFDYVWLEQHTSYNDGVDFDLTAQWKHLRDEQSMKMLAEWCSRQPVRFEVPPEVA